MSEAGERGFGEALFAELASCGGYASAGAPESGRKTFPLPGDPRVYGRDRPMRIEHLRLDLTFDLRRHRVHGVATTTFRPRQDGLREAVFDAIELDVESVEGATRGWRGPAAGVHRGRRRAADRPRTAAASVTVDHHRGGLRGDPAARAVLQRAGRGLPGAPAADLDAGAGRRRGLLLPHLRFPR